ncbi:helix-turn-helix transcriptional regulator [Streptomyces sp. NPDC054783]
MAEQVPAHADEPAGTSDPTAEFSARLDQLFRTVHPSERAPWSNAEVARAVGVSETYIGYLRKGTRRNPTLTQMQALADFFGVPLAYFFDDGQGEQVRQDLALLTQLKGMGVREIALRTIAEMSEDSVTTVLPVLQRLAETQVEKQSPRGRRMPSRPRSAGESPGAL